MKKSTLAAIAAAALAAAPPLLADVDLNTFIHGGSTARPLAYTTASGEIVLDAAMDSGVKSSEDAVLVSAFDSWWQFIGEVILGSGFSTFNLPFTLIVK